jgi:hypothetical protein
MNISTYMFTKHTYLIVKEEIDPTGTVSILLSSMDIQTKNLKIYPRTNQFHGHSGHNKHLQSIPSYGNDYAFFSEAQGTFPKITISEVIKQPSTNTK